MSQTKFVNSLTLKSIVQAFVEQEVMIKSFTIEPASRNNTTLAEIYRIFAQYSSDSTKADVFKAVAKAKPTKGTLAQEFQESDAFDKELFVYRAILPKLSETLRGLVKVNFGPNLIFTLSSPTDVIILEDLTDVGFAPESPSIGLNENQAKFAIEKLAFFHAASVVRLNDSPELFSRFERGTFHQDFVSKLHYFVDALKFLTDNGRSLGLEEATITKLQSLPAVLTKKAIEIYNDPNTSFKVLNHGDFNTSNILFKYNRQGELEDCAFVDFQNSFVGSPVIDLIFFLTTSIEPAVLAEKRDDLIYAYYVALDTVLNNLGYKGRRITLLELQIELLKKGALEVIFTLTAAPYLRTSDKKIVPAVIPSLHNDQIVGDLKSEGIALLRENKEFLLNQIERFESLGLLEWGLAESKVRGLLSRFQGVKIAA